jgi:acyl-CoA synthetase (NDP forming)
MYIESFADWASLLRTGQGRSKKKPIVAVKVGTIQRAKAAASILEPSPLHPTRW